MGSTPLITRPLHFAIRRSRPGAEALVSRFNSTLQRLVADGTYHRLLHVDWIRADVDGDGRKELVARSDKAGAKPPARTYDLFATPPSEPSTPSKEPRFYVGGSIYESWAAVPENYKLSNSDAPDPSRSTASIFRFSW